MNWMLLNTHVLQFCFKYYFYSIFQADVDNSGTIDYGEFVAAMLHLNKIQKEDHLFAAFSYFDKDGSGYITQDELQQACEKFGLADIRLEDIMREVDQDNVIVLLLIIYSIASLSCLNDWNIKGLSSIFNNHAFDFFSGWSNRLQWVCGYDARHWFSPEVIVKLHDDWN